MSNKSNPYLLYQNLPKIVVCGKIKIISSLIGEGIIGIGLQICME